MTVLLGGSENPLGAVVQFLRAPLPAVVEDLRRWFDPTPLGVPLVEALPRLLPFEAPWSRVLLAETGGWTALLNNGLVGGDSTAPGPGASDRLGGIECLVAEHLPRHGPGHQGTQLEVFGPDGEPPLMHRRVLSATATDGRWEWHEAGEPYPFEDVGRYAARRVRDRYDRDLLLDHLEALGVPARDDAAYGPATLLQRREHPPAREVGLAEARADFA